MTDSPRSRCQRLLGAARSNFLYLRASPLLFEWRVVSEGLYARPRDTVLPSRQWLLGAARRASPEALEKLMAGPSPGRASHSDATTLCRFRH